MASTTKGTETTHKEGEEDVTVVNTVDHRSYPTAEGKEDKSTTEDVQVVHRTGVSHPDDKQPSTAASSNTSIGETIVFAAVNVANTARSAKDAISSSISPSTDDKTPKVVEESTNDVSK